MSVYNVGDEVVRAAANNHLDNVPAGYVGVVTNWFEDDMNKTRRYAVEWRSVPENYRPHVYYPVELIPLTEEPEEAAPEPGAKSEPDMVNNPPHYTRGGIEVLDFIMAYFADDYLGGQVVKYLSRAGYKWDALEDLKKAAFYLNRKIEEMEKGASE